jgi:WD40 repeat protein
VSKDGNYLGCGDNNGILRIYSTQTFAKEYEIQAHDQDITTLDFSPLNDLGHDYLATGSRDRLIHVYDVA